MLYSILQNFLGCPILAKRERTFTVWLECLWIVWNKGFLFNDSKHLPHIEIDEVSVLTCFRTRNPGVDGYISPQRKSVQKQYIEPCEKVWPLNITACYFWKL